MSRTVTRLALGVVAGGLAIALSACSPVLTTKPYAPSDGVRVTWGQDLPAIKGENLLVLASAEGAEARIVGGLTNSTPQEVTVTLGFAGAASESITIDPSSTVLLDGSPAGDLVLPLVPAPPGAMVEMVFATPTLGQVTVQVPVLDDTFEEYAALVP